MISLMTLLTPLRLHGRLLAGVISLHLIAIGVAWFPKSRPMPPAMVMPAEIIVEAPAVQTVTALHRMQHSDAPRSAPQAEIRPVLGRRPAAILPTESTTPSASQPHSQPTSAGSGQIPQTTTTVSQDAPTVSSSASSTASNPNELHGNPASEGHRTFAASTRVELPSSSAEYLSNGKPAYPGLSRRLGEQGKVILRVYIDVDGTASRAQVQHSSGFERLDQAALQTVLRWRYVPGKRGGVAEAMWFDVPLSFVLE